MSLVAIADFPESQEAFFIWAQAHASHHYDIIRAAGLQFNQVFSQYILDPFDPKDMDAWLEQHQQMHQEMNQALSLSSQYDLSELEWNSAQGRGDWFAQNFTEHQQWAAFFNLG